MMCFGLLREKQSACLERRERNEPVRSSRAELIAEPVAGPTARLLFLLFQASANTIAPANVMFGKCEKTAARRGGGLESGCVFVLNFLDSPSGARDSFESVCRESQRAWGDRKRCAGPHAD